MSSSVDLASILTGDDVDMGRDFRDDPDNSTAAKILTDPYDLGASHSFLVFEGVLRGRTFGEL